MLQSLKKMLRVDSEIIDCLNFAPKRAQITHLALTGTFGEISNI